MALLTAPLAFTFFDAHDDEGVPLADPVALLEALRRHAEKITLFCQAGAIGVPKPQQRLMAYLEGSVFEVEARSEGGIFHPKIWVLNFEASDRSAIYRVLCLSRNLTFARAWDTCLRLEGRLTRRQRGYSPQIRCIGQLRALLAEVCVTALEPDLVIIDEFQRFKHLLDGGDATSRLARHLFNYSDDTADVRLLLLSATPYRMYTLHHESAEDDHYRDFLRTVEFLDPELKESGELRGLLDDYRQAMYRIDAGTEPLVRIKGKIETQLRRVMSRTERLRVSTESDGMLREVPCAGLELTTEDVQDFLALEKIGREVGQPRVLDYWKSAPYLLSFMDDYQLKKKVMARLDMSSDDGLEKLLTDGGRVSLSWEEVEAYAQLDPANARLRSLLDWLERGEAWRLLWLPPALPYYGRVRSLEDGARAAAVEAFDLLDLASRPQGYRGCGELRCRTPRFPAL